MVATDRALSELRGLGIYTTEALSNIAHETCGADSTVKYVYAATNVQSLSVEEKSETIPETFKQSMTLLTKLEWKTTSDKEVGSLTKNDIHTLLPATSVPTAHKIIGRRWVYKVKADDSRKGRVVVRR